MKATNRPKEYRAWNGEKMITPAISLEDGSGYVVHSLQFDGTESALRTDFRRFTWLEYTGKKDHKGVKIYEGDIVKGFDYDGTVLMGTVKFENCAWIVAFDERTAFLSAMTDLSVLGHIYQFKN